MKGKEGHQLLSGISLELGQSPEHLSGTAVQETACDFKVTQSKKALIV